MSISLDDKRVTRKRAGNLFSKLQYKIHLSVENNSQRLLSLDLLKNNFKKDLLTVIVNVIENKILNTLNNQTDDFVNLGPGDVKKEFSKLVKTSTEDFLFSHYGIRLKVQERIIDNSLCIQSLANEFDIIYKTPIEAVINPQAVSFRSLFSPIYNYASEDFLEALLDNLILEISNCVVYLIAVDLSFLTDFQKTMYKSNFLSLRNLERFKNNLTWQLRTKIFILRPLDIYNNRYSLFILRTSGIYSRTIYANRSRDITTLKEIPLLTISLVEAKDFFVSRVEETFYLVGSGLRFTLTSIVGQLVGLVWRGIIEGLKK